MTSAEKKYKVWVFEDSQIVRKTLESTSENANFEILLWLETFPAALHALESFDQTAEITPDAVLIDGNLTKLDMTGNDGKGLVKAAKARGLLTVAFTNFSIDADINPSKKPNWEKLRELLNEYFLGLTSSQT